MRCIYLNANDVCKAHPYGDTFDYKPEAETLKAYCKHELDMRGCPRLTTYQAHLSALQKE